MGNPGKTLMVCIALLLCQFAVAQQKDDQQDRKQTYGENNSYDACGAEKLSYRITAQNNNTGQPCKDGDH